MTTCQNIIATLRAANILPPAQINYGLSDSLKPPYLQVTDYSHTIDYDTGGPVEKKAAFTITVFDKSQDDAETIAEQFDNILNNSKTLTPTTMGCFQENYQIGQLEMPAYQFGVQISYALQEDMTR